MDLINKMYTTAEIDYKSFNDEEQSFVAWASKPVLDRDNELIKADAWDIKNYETNNVICWAHDYSKPPVGSSLWTKVQKDGLQFKPSFAGTEMGKELYQLYKDKVLKAFSVGFVPKEGGFIEGTKAGEPKRTYTDVELLEISCVTIPSCPEALVAAYDSGEIKTKGLQDAVEFAIGKDAEVVTKPETTENYHRIPVNQCKITATIDISKEKGIKALYCGNEKKVATYLFDKDKWTMAEAKKWVAGHDAGKAVMYKCECIECGHKIESEKHCKDIKCEKCGAQMRRVERPGPGQASFDSDGKYLTLGDVLEYHEKLSTDDSARYIDVKEEVFLRDALSRRYVSLEGEWHSPEIDTEWKEGRRFSAKTLSLMRIAYDALGSLLETPEEIVTDDVDKDIEVKDTDDLDLDKESESDEITPELAKWLLDQDDEEKKAAADEKVTFADKLLAAQGKFV